MRQSRKGFFENLSVERMRKRNADRQQNMLTRSTNISFLKLPNDGDMTFVRIIAPFEGFDRKVKQMNSDEKKLKPHYRMYEIGNSNKKTRRPLSDPPLEMTINDIRELRDRKCQNLDYAQ